MIYDNFININNKLSELYQGNKMHHCILLNGQKGIGKFSFSQEFINNQLNSNNIYHNSLYIDNGDKRDITIDKIRSIKDFVNKSSINNCDKFIIIDSICIANLSAQNSILKILEEPNPRNYFFLICHNINQILATIKSRSYIINCTKLNNDQFKKHISNHIIAKNEIDYLFLSQICNNSVGIAQNDGLNLIKFYQFFIKSFANKLLDDDIIKLISNKDFTIGNLLAIYEFFTLRILKRSVNINIDDFYNDIAAIDQINKKINYNKLKFIIDDSTRMINEARIYNLDKKTLLINIFNYLNTYD
jgi:DNA polymerase III subunit delta'|tara:strand:+ start:12354 stop:13259 length:906 start_codon:yes stop_codon:yes gene_type:complete